MELNPLKRLSQRQKNLLKSYNFWQDGLHYMSAKQIYWFCAGIENVDREGIERDLERYGQTLEYRRNILKFAKLNRENECNIIALEAKYLAVGCRVSVLKLKLQLINQLKNEQKTLF